MNHYWVHNFNSTSSLLGGAVIAGNAENTSIYYNPATIGEMESGNSVSIAANLFTWNVYNLKNALGDGIDVNTNNFLVQPQFFSYSYKPNQKGLNISVAVLTRVKEKLEMSYNNTTYVDVLKAYPGVERYHSSFYYRNEFNDTWIGAAISQDVTSNFSYGLSLFVSVASLKYRYSYSAIAAYSEDTISINQYDRTAEGSYGEMLKFTDFRLILKLGLSYQYRNWRIGFTMTSPTWRLFSSGKGIQRVEKQINIMRNDNPVGFVDFVIFDGQEKSEMSTNFKSPFSSGLGIIYNFINRGQKLYFSTEYFAGMKTYKMVDAQLHDYITGESVYDTLTNKDWSSVVYAADPVINVAIGYSWTLSGGLIFMNALRTDFSAINEVDLNNYKNYNYLKTYTYNIYHYSVGVEFKINKNRFIAGGDLAFGYQTNQPQIANFSQPMEYNEQSGRALQGPIENKMDLYYFGISVYLGATLNFTKDKPARKK